MSAERKFLDVVSGQSRGVGASLARAGLGALSPLYRGVVQARNGAFAAGLKKAIPLGRPTVSVGNITTGGTGKTPVVQWLVGRLSADGRTPAVLMRGYKARDGFSDEAQVLRDGGATVIVDPDRVAGATAALVQRSDIATFVLDDGFQHRRAARDFDLVLIDATNPFGHGHLLPRGLLREPVSALSRANAVLITRADADADLAGVTQTIRQYTPTAQVFRCRHVCRGLIDADGRPTTVRGPVLAVSGIGNPAAFVDSLKAAGVNVAASQALGDHHAYTTDDIEVLRRLTARHETIVVTEKDWVKLRRVPGAGGLPIARSVLGLDFADGHEDALYGLIHGRMFREEK